MTTEAFLEGHVRAFAWLGGVPRECVYDNLRSAVARRERDVVTWNPRFGSVPYVAGWGEHGALDAVTRFAATIDDFARRIETAIQPRAATLEAPTDSTVRTPAPRRESLEIPQYGHNRPAPALAAPTHALRTVAAGCHRLPIGLFEPFMRRSHVRPGCHRLRPLGSINAPCKVAQSLV
jgi:hypothetical protein